MDVTRVGVPTVVSAKWLLHVARRRHCQILTCRQIVFFLSFTLSCGITQNVRMAEL